MAHSVYLEMTKRVEYDSSMEVELPFGWVSDDIDNYMELDWFPSMGDCVVVELCSLMVMRTLTDYMKPNPTKTEWETLYADENLMVQGRMLKNDAGYDFRMVIPMQNDWEEGYQGDDVEIGIG